MLYRLSYFRNSRFFLVISSLDFASSVGHYQEVTPSILTRPPRNPSKTNFDFVRGKFHFSKQKPDRFGAGFLWEKMDSNHRRYKPADLQSAPFGHSGILPFSRFFLVISSLDFASSVGHYQEVTPSILTRPPRNSSKTNFENPL